MDDCAGRTFVDYPLVDVAFASELCGVLAVVSPLDVGLLVLPVPRLDEDHVVLVDPRAKAHPAGDTAHALFAVVALETNAPATEHVGDDREHLIVVGHPEVPSPRFFAHRRCMNGRRLNNVLRYAGA